MFWCEYPRDVVRVHGADCAGYLQSQTSQDLSGLSVGAAAWSFLLQPTGKVDVLARVCRLADDEFVLDTDSGFGDALEARLQRFRIRVKAELERLAWRCLAVRGPGADGLLVDAVRQADAAPVVVASWGAGVDLLGEDPLPPTGVAAGAATDLLRARIDAAWPQMGAEIVPGETIPAETGVIDAAVSFTKGCYPGQELVERMDSRGAAARRRLQRVRVSDHPGPYTSVCGDAALAYIARTSL